MRALIILTAILLQTMPATSSARDAQAAFRPATPAAGTEPALVFTAAPRESRDTTAAMYGPIADFLSQQLGRPVVFHQTDSWGVYQTAMVRGDFDLVFDGPHFNAYRMDKLQHEVLVKLPGTFQFAIVARETPSFVFKGIQRLYGRRFCALAPPNLGTLVLLRLYDNPLRQPVIVPRLDFQSVYEGVMNGRCEAGVIPLAQLRQLDPQEKMRVLYFSTEMPGPALSAGPRVSPEERRKIVAALTGPEGQAVSEPLRAAWGVRAGFVAAQRDDYAGLSVYLREQWGFY